VNEYGALELLDDSVEADEEESISTGDEVAMGMSEDEMEIRDDNTMKKPLLLISKNEL
jgi:hypothetical protein